MKNVQMHNGSISFLLYNNVKVPGIAFGTWKVKDFSQLEVAIKCALDDGYRHIDTAAIYDNEHIIGELIHLYPIKRDELFITTKLWGTELKYPRAQQAFKKSLERLRLDYIDLYLIHWPSNNTDIKLREYENLEAWKALEDIYSSGKVRAIGVSNFLADDLEILLSKANIVPMLNQIEYHVGQVSHRTMRVCDQNNIAVSAWSPLGHGNLLKNPDLIEIANKYKISVAQLCLVWCLQHNVLPVVKSINPSRIRENISIKSIHLNEKDMKHLDALPYIGGSGLYFNRFKDELIF